ncbi:hypothetical protein [Streptomyces sp. ME19-01-6]|uniref:hypothetical protein n=1 Tax=Streptomyces sp. ME19-01-6 TaxID=3028686 RepID=UPI0029CA3581|nr:hypothetical protein [Streptomyces sp. ME19-01-6]
MAVHTKEILGGRTAQAFDEFFGLIGGVGGECSGHGYCTKKLTSDHVVGAPRVVLCVGRRACRLLGGSWLSQHGVEFSEVELEYRSEFRS